MDDYNCEGHSKYSMKVHLIFVTKYRKIMFKSDNIGQVSQEIIEKYIQNQG